MTIKKILRRTLRNVLRDKASRRWSFVRRTPKSPLARARARFLKVRA
ncbi:hypothetical protein [Sagittula salina]|uniref:Uncharacterized protein n=1 Tax=Sagittula salina TaxID=2820268 RepID=A0A940S0G8_9RHOB|nr:hypothetical protein [Sagittula salina]MBP0482012.1 hypothetical protein [Sagittula salina]